MFCKAYLFVVTLAVLITASPVKKAAAGVSIPLHKRGTLSKSDGTFDLNKAVAHTVATKKYVIYDK